MDSLTFTFVILSLMVTVATPWTTIHLSDLWLWYWKDVWCPGLTVSRLTLKPSPWSRIINDPHGLFSLWFLLVMIFNYIYLRFAPVNSCNCNASNHESKQLKTFNSNQTNQTNNNYPRKKFFFKLYTGQIFSCCLLSKN